MPLRPEDLTNEQLSRLIPALRMVPEKTLWVCKQLGMPLDKIRGLLLKTNIPAIIQACYRNDSIQEMRQFRSPYFTGRPGDADYAAHQVFGDRTLLTSPLMRVEFSHTIVFGCITDAYCVCKNKSWGKEILSLEPLKPTDKINPWRVTYYLKATSHMRQRWEWRDTIKAILGDDRFVELRRDEKRLHMGPPPNPSDFTLVPDGAYVVGDVQKPRFRKLRECLVNRAVRTTKSDFLASLNPSDRSMLRSRLDMTPEDFWVHVRYGERFGPGSIDQFVTAMMERKRGYCFEFQDSIAL